MFIFLKHGVNNVKALLVSLW